jgi:hypothetical protein
MMIGDTTADLKMARAAGAGLVVGVLCGVSNARDLIPYADVLVESVEELLTRTRLSMRLPQTGSLLSDLNPEKRSIIDLEFVTVHLHQIMSLRTAALGFWRRGNLLLPEIT